MASALKYFTLPKSKVTIWEKPLKAGGVFYYLYLDQSQVSTSQAEELKKLIEYYSLVSSVKLKKTTKTYQISYSYRNGEKAQNSDETMLEMLDDKLASFGYDDTKNQAVGTRGKKMIGTYSTQGQSTITVTKPASPDYKVGDVFYHHTFPNTKYNIIEIDGGFIKYSSEDGQKYTRSKDDFEENLKTGIWVIEKPQVSQPQVKVYEFYIDYDKGGKLLVVTEIDKNTQPARVYYKHDGNNRHVDFLEEFEKLISKGSYVLYVPIVNDEWKVYDDTSGKVKFTRKITSVSSTDVVYEVYDEQDKYIDTRMVGLMDFCDDLVFKGFIFSQKGGQVAQTQQASTQPEIKVGQYYINYYQSKGNLLEVYDLRNDRVYLTNDNNVSVNNFNKYVSEGRVKLYTPNVGDEWVMYDKVSSTIETTYRVLSASEKYVTFARYERGNYVSTDSLLVKSFCGTLSTYDFRISKVGGQTTQPQTPSTTTWVTGDLLVYYDGRPRLIKGYDPENIKISYYSQNESKTLEAEINISVFKDLLFKGELRIYEPKVGDVWENEGYDTEITYVKEKELGLKIINKETNYAFKTFVNKNEYYDRVVLANYRLIKQGGQQLQPTSESKTEYEKEAEEFAKSKDPKYSEKSILKKELKDLVELKDLISDLDFEDKVNVSTLITKTQNKINDIIAKELEQKIGDAKIFDELFEQSFTPLQNRYDAELEKNDLLELVAPNGQISDLNEEVTTLVNSELFKEWFGDFKTAYFYRNMPDFGGIRVSKVLSEKFEPLVVWHGTGKQFSYFRFDNFPAAYFAVNRKYSDFFAKVHSEDGVGYVLPFFININNPLDLSSFGNDKVKSKDFFDWMYLKTGLTPEELEINPLMLDSTMPPVPIWVYLRNNATMLKKIAEMGVYDGIKFYEFNPNVDPSDDAYETLAYITFDPHQSKLADPKRGQILLASLKSFMLKKGGKV